MQRSSKKERSLKTAARQRVSYRGVYACVSKLGADVLDRPTWLWRRTVSEEINADARKKRLSKGRYPLVLLCERSRQT